MTTTPAPYEHPLLAAAREVGRVLDETAGSDPMFLSPGDKQALLVELTRSLGRLAGLRARTLATSDDLAAETGSRDAAAWLAVETRTSRREAMHDSRLGASLGRWARVAAAVAAGAVTWEQADVVMGALEALPASLERELVTQAEAHLIDEASRFGPRELRVLGRRLLEVVAPEIADAEEEAALREEERRARRTTRLSFRPRGDGSTDLHARLPDHVASRLRAYLDAMTSPRRNGPSAAPLGDVDRVALPRRRGEAFCSLLEQLPADGLPQHGGTATAGDGDGRPRDPALRSRSGRDLHRRGGHRRRGPQTGLHRRRPSRRTGSQGRGPRPRALEAPVLTRSAQGHGRPRPPRAATSRRPGARPITHGVPGLTAATPTWPTASCSARSTTTEPTTHSGVSRAWPTATSATPGGRETARGRLARSERAQCDLREQQGQGQQTEPGGEQHRPRPLVVPDDRDEAGDEGGHRARPDADAPHELSPAVGVALGWFHDPERERAHQQGDAGEAQPREGDPRLWSVPLSQRTLDVDRERRCSMSTQNTAPRGGGTRSRDASPANDSANRAYRRAWWSLALYPVAFVAAFVIGEGLYSVFTGDQGSAAWWEILLAATPAILVFAIPGILAWTWGCRAVRLGRRDGNLPAFVGAALAVGFVGVNLLSGLLRLIFG